MLYQLSTARVVTTSAIYTTPIRTPSHSTRIHSPTISLARSSTWVASSLNHLQARHLFSKAPLSSDSRRASKAPASHFASRLTSTSAIMSGPKILVSGSGIAGGVFAHWLLRAYRNAEITVVERDSSMRLTGASVDIRSNAVDIIKEMGAEPAIRGQSTKEEG